MYADTKLDLEQTKTDLASISHNFIKYSSQKLKVVLFQQISRIWIKSKLTFRIWSRDMVIFFEFNNLIKIVKWLFEKVDFFNNEFYFKLSITLLRTLEKSQSLVLIYWLLAIKIQEFTWSKDRAQLKALVISKHCNFKSPGKISLSFSLKSLITV